MQLNESQSEATLNQAIKEANQRLAGQGHSFKVVYVGQPNVDGKKIGGEQPLDLALVYSDQKVVPIDFVNVVELSGFDESEQKRLVSGLKSSKKLSDEIVAKVEQHLKATEDQNVLISASGSKFNTQNLRHHIVSIDSHNFLLLDGQKILYHTKIGEPALLQTSNLRSSGII